MFYFIDYIKGTVLHAMLYSLLYARPIHLIHFSSSFIDTDTLPTIFRLAVDSYVFDDLINNVLWGSVLNMWKHFCFSTLLATLNDCSE